MNNIPAGYNDEGGRGLSQREAEHIEENWDSVEAYLGKKGWRLKCYQCTKTLRELNMVGGRYVCEDCIAELNLK